MKPYQMNKFNLLHILVVLSCIYRILCFFNKSYKAFFNDFVYKLQSDDVNLMLKAVLHQVVYEPLYIT